MTLISRKSLVRFSALLPLILTLYVHSSILTNFFIQDDYLHLFHIANLGFWEFFLKPHGGHLQLFRNLVFFISFKLFGLNAFYYFLTVLVTHLVNVTLVYHIIKNLSGRIMPPLLGASVWGACALHQGVLGFYSVFGQVMASAFICLALHDISRISIEKTRISRSKVIKWMLLLVGAANCFGTGLSVAACFGIVAGLLLSDKKGAAKATKSLLLLLVIIPILYISLIQLYEWKAGISETSTDLLPFVIYSLPKAVQFAVSLFGYGTLNLLAIPFITFSKHDKALTPISGVSATTIYHLTYAISAFVFICFVLSLKKASKKQKNQIVAFAILIFLTYGIIAIGRTWYFGLSRMPLDQVFYCTRYQYSGTMMITILFCLLISVWKINRSKIVLALQILGIIYLVAATQHNKRLSPRIMEEKGLKEKREVRRVVKELKFELKSNAFGDKVYLKNRPLSYVSNVKDYNHPATSRAAIFMLTFPNNTVDGKRVYFIDSQGLSSTTMRIRKDMRIAKLLVPDVHSKPFADDGNQ